MRTLLTGERAIIAGSKVAHWLRVEIQRGQGGNYGSIAAADFFDDAHSPWNVSGYSYAAHCTRTAGSSGFAFGNSGVGEDGSACAVFAMSSGHGVYETDDEVLSGLLPNTAYVVEARVAAAYNAGFAGTEVGFIANGVTASAFLPGGSTMPWQTISAAVTSDAFGVITVRKGILNCISVGFVVQMYVSIDSLKVIGAAPANTYIDYSTQLGVDWQDVVDIVESKDQALMSATVQLAREAGSLSLAPLMSASLANLDSGGSYSPALSPGNAIRISSATTTGGAPSSGDWRFLFDGVIDNVEWGSSPVTVSCRDKYADIADTYIEVDGRTYGDPLGVPVETVLQQILNDNLASPPALYVPVATGVQWTAYTQGQTNVLDAERAIALEISYDLRGRWYGTSWNLTLYQPNRAQTIADFTIGPSEYRNVSKIALDREGVRNVIELSCRDASTGQRIYFTAIDNSSINAYGRRTLQIDLADDSPIDSYAELVQLANDILSDLKAPFLEQEIETLHLWFAQLDDLVQFTANGVHYDQDQKLAITSIRHHFERGEATTFLGTRGHPIGAYREWLARGNQGRLPGVPEILFVDAPTPLYEGGQFVGWRVTGACDTDSKALVIGLSSGLTIRNTVPPNFATTGPTGLAEYWIDLSGVNKGFTIDLLQPNGGQDEIVLEPREFYNPTAAFPRPGKVGEAWHQPLSLVPYTIDTIRFVSTTRFSINLTTSPATSTIRYRLDPAAPSDPWISVTNAAGSVTIGDGSLANPYLDCAMGDRVIEFYAVSTTGVVEPVHRRVIDSDTIAEILLTLTEPQANVLQIDATLDDDVLSWSVWAKRGSSPIPVDAVDPDDTYRLINHWPRHKSQIRTAAGGSGGGTADTWYVVARAYDFGGVWTQVEAQLMITGVGVASLSGVQTFFRGNPYWLVGINWTPSAAIVAAAAGRYVIRTTANGTQIDPNGATTDPTLGQVVDAQAVTFFWNGPVAILGTIPPGSIYTPYTYVLELYDTSGGGAPVLVGTYQVIDHYYLDPADPTDPTDTTPGSAPPTPTLATSTSGTLKVTATFTGATTTDPIEVEFNFDPNASFAAGGGSLYETLTTHPPGVTATSVGYNAGDWIRARGRYTNSAGQGPWSSWSAIAQMPVPPVVIQH